MSCRIAHHLCGIYFSQSQVRIQLFCPFWDRSLKPLQLCFLQCSLVWYMSSWFGHFPLIAALLQHAVISVVSVGTWSDICQHMVKSLDVARKQSKKHEYISQRGTRNHDYTEAHRKRNSTCTLWLIDSLQDICLKDNKQIPWKDHGARRMLFLFAVDPVVIQQLLKQHVPLLKWTQAL